MRSLFNSRNKMSKLTEDSRLVLMSHKTTNDKTAEIKELRPVEYLAVSGGPQIHNESDV